MKCISQYISIKRVRSAEVMLLRSIMLADEQLNLTDKTLDNYLNLTDEIILEQMCLLGSSNKVQHLD